MTGKRFSGGLNYWTRRGADDIIGQNQKSHDLVCQVLYFMDDIGMPIDPGVCR